MKQILIMQSRERPEVVAAEKEEYRKAVRDKVTLTFISTLDESLAWDTPRSMLEGYDAVIIGGSGEFDLHNQDMESPKTKSARAILARMSPLISYLLESDFPTLGICFGHQLIGELKGGIVSSDSTQEKVGSHEIHLTDAGEKDPLLHELPTKFVAQYGHRNSLTALPTGSTLLAKSDMCRFSALRYGSRVYTMQFHPELTREDVFNKFKMYPDYLPSGMTPELLAKESREASQIIPLFIERISNE